MVDARATIVADAGKGGRANGIGGTDMARRSSQDGCVFKRGKKGKKVWVGRWRETVSLPDGTVKRVLRSEVLGDVKSMEEKSIELDMTAEAYAKNLVRERIRDTNGNRLQPLNSQTFTSFIEGTFKPGALRILKYATRLSYLGLLEKHLVPRFGGRPLRDLKGSEIQIFLLEKLDHGLAWETVNHLRWLMSKVFEAAITDKLITENPVPGKHGVKMPQRTLKRPHSALTLPELLRLLTELEGTARMIVVLAASLGLRIGEILALRWNRIDFDRGILRVAETNYKGHFGTPKSDASIRDIPVPAMVLKELIDHRQRCFNVSLESLVFSTRNGTPLSADNLRKRELAAACEAARIRRIDWHTLRHTHATLLHAKGVPLKIAQAQLGHARMSTTCEVYTHAVTDDQRTAIDELSHDLFPSVPKLQGNQAGAKAVSPLIQ